ncbi:MAG: DUF4328 domain-containing protein [Acidimicrobiia bacterium]|nr:DUF4328 domain-containing protein [Acidimicrobiia bacterium]
MVPTQPRPRARRRRGLAVGSPPAAAVPHRFGDLGPLAGLVRALLAACAVVMAGSVVADVAQFVFVDDLYREPASTVAVDRLEVSDLWQFLLALVLFAVAVPTAVTFLMWLRQAHLNLAALGAPDQRFSATWVVAAWFVPVVNLVVPKLAVDEIWRDSEPEAPSELTVLDDRGRVPPTVHIWWGCLAGAVVCWLVGLWFLSGSVVDPGRERIGYAFEIGASALGLAAAVLAYGLVGALSRRQAARAHRLGIDRGSRVPARVDRRPADGPPANGAGVPTPATRATCPCRRLGVTASAASLTCPRSSRSRPTAASRRPSPAGGSSRSTPPTPGS